MAGGHFGMLAEPAAAKSGTRLTLFRARGDVLKEARLSRWLIGVPCFVALMVLPAIGLGDEEVAYRI